VAGTVQVEMVFSIPTLHDNVDGWGPCTVPEEYKDIPYAPFSKNDRLGKAADWINLGYQKFSSACGPPHTTSSHSVVNQPPPHANHPQLSCGCGWQAPPRAVSPAIGQICSGVPRKAACAS
jgi:hypothetical protein